VQKFSYPRYSTLMERLSAEGDAARYRAFWRVVAAHSPEVEGAGRVDFYQHRFLTDPERRAQGPVGRQRVYRMELRGEERARGDGRRGASGAENLSRPLTPGD
jgi:hypothetical protein